MKKILLLFAVVSSFSVFAFKDGDWVFPQIKNTKSISFNYDDYEEGERIYYKGRVLFCPHCSYSGWDLWCEVDNSTGLATLTCYTQCQSGEDFSITFTEAQLDDYAWGVADDMSGSPFQNNDTVSPDAEYHGTKTLPSGGSSSGQDQNDPGEGGNTSGQGGGYDSSLIRLPVNMYLLLDSCVIGFASFLGVSLCGFVIFLVIRRSLSKMKMIDGSSSETSTSDRPEK